MDAFISGLSASIVAIIAWEVVSVLKDNLSYHRMIGHYEGFRFINDNANPLVLSTKQSEAEIDYPSSLFRRRFALFDRNVLRITLKHGSNNQCVWTGLITMQTKSFGTCDWRYIKGVNGESFGAKWVVVSKKTTEPWFYIIEFVRPESFGKEAFRRTGGLTWRVAERDSQN